MVARLQREAGLLGGGAVSAEGSSHGLFDVEMVEQSLVEHVCYLVTVPVGQVHLLPIVGEGGTAIETDEERVSKCRGQFGYHRREVRPVLIGHEDLPKPLPRLPPSRVVMTLAVVRGFGIDGLSCAVDEVPNLSGHLVEVRVAKLFVHPVRMARQTRPRARLSKVYPPV